MSGHYAHQLGIRYNIREGGGGVIDVLLSPLVDFMFKRIFGDEKKR